MASNGPSPFTTQTDGLDSAPLLTCDNADRLTGHPWKCFEQKLVLANEDQLWAKPQRHIVCASTLATRDPELIGAARSEAGLWQIDTGHDLMITEPQFVADALMEIAAR